MAAGVGAADQRIMRWVINREDPMWRIGLVLLLVGCAKGIEVVSASPYEITIMQRHGAVRNPGKMAAEHCGKHGKIALATEYVRLTSGWGHYGSPIIHYQCIEGPVNTRP